MFDLIGSHLRLKRIYRSYIESAFPLRFDVLNRERARLLDNEHPGHLTQPALIEPMPIYTSSGQTLRNIAAGLGNDYEGFQELARGLVPQGVELYEHQTLSLETALSGKDLVVTTGTGSGKTECFLLPLFAELAREMKQWSPMGSHDPRRYWWRGSGEEQAGRRGGARREIGQFAHSQRPHAVRALILYPLNALVEDQLRRLRMALDNPDTNHWLDRERGGNRITFGRYTGATPVAGKPSNSNKVKQLTSALRELHGREQAIQKKLDHATGAEKERLEDVRYFFPSMESGEMWSRWDMQETPPDILITNYSMLNIMLNREVEEGIFEQTREWLRSNPDNHFHLIVDELHAYRGTQGTEVGYVLRLLLHRLGLSPESGQLRIITTSASIEKDDKSRTFLEEFFGRPKGRFTIVDNRQTEPREGLRNQITEHAAVLRQFCDAVDSESVAKLGRQHMPWQPPITAVRNIGKAMEDLAVELALVDPERQPDAKVLLGNALDRIDAEEALRDAVRAAAGGGEVRPVPLDRLDRVLFPDEVERWNPFPEHGEGSLSKALRGFLLSLAISQRGENDERAAAPTRGHLFYHNHQNLWACSNPDCDDDNCLPDERSKDDMVSPPVGALHATHRLSCSCGGRVLDLVVCEA